MNRFILFATFVLTIAAPALAARVTVEPASSAVYIGQTVTLRYRLTDTTEPAAAPSLAIDGCTVRYAGVSQNSNTQISGNRRVTKNEFVYSYSVRPHEAGSFTASPLKFTLPNGETVLAPAATFVSGPAPKSDDFRLFIEAEENEVYVGQPVRITWTWLAAQRVASAEITWPAPRDAEVFVTEASDPDRNRGGAAAEMLGLAATLRTDRRSIDGRAWNVYQTELVVVPTRAGKFQLPSSSVLIDADTGRRRRGVSVFDSRTITETYMAQADSPVIRVRDLPSKGRPSSFSGLVGRYSLESIATPTSVRVGDPIELTLLVRGPAAASTEPSIDLQSIPGFADAFRIDAATDHTTKVRSGTLIKHTLRAQDDGVTSIPPIELPYFDPDLGRYAVARTAPIPLEVAPTRIVTLADAKGEFEEDPTGAAIESRDGGLRANFVEESALESEHFDTTAMFKEPVFLGLLTLPPAAFVLSGAIALARSRRSRTAENRASKRALPRALDALKNADEPDRIAETLRKYLAVRFPEAGAAVTPEDVTRLLGDGDAVTELANVLGACDAARFGGASADTAALTDRAAHALRTLEKGAAS